MIFFKELKSSFINLIYYIFFEEYVFEINLELFNENDNQQKESR
jgi:hypothetical protein